MSCTFRTNLLACIIFCALELVVANTAFSSPLTFEGTNPGFFSTASPNGVASLMNSVVKPTNPSTNTSTNPADLVQRGVLSQISTKINNQIFNTANQSGLYDLGGGNQVSFVRTGGNIVITFVDARTGTTVITMPDI
jgi:hypothetical protein